MSDFKSIKDYKCTNPLEQSGYDLEELSDPYNSIDENGVILMPNGARIYPSEIKKSDKAFWIMLIGIYVAWITLSIISNAFGKGITIAIIFVGLFILSAILPKDKNENMQ